MKEIAIEIGCIHQLVGQGRAIDGDYLVLVSHLVDDFHQVAAVGAPENMNFFLQDHFFTYLLALVLLGHIVGLDYLYEFFLAVYPDAAPLVDVMRDPLDD